MHIEVAYDVGVEAVPISRSITRIYCNKLFGLITVLHLNTHFVNEDFCRTFQNWKWAYQVTSLCVLH
jgi:hypothetical protein